MWISARASAGATAPEPSAGREPARRGASAVALGPAAAGRRLEGMSRYGKRADLIVHEHEPLNAETGPPALAAGPLTATDAFYVRRHGAVPEIDPAAWRLQVRG